MAEKSHCASLSFTFPLLPLLPPFASPFRTTSNPRKGGLFSRNLPWHPNILKEQDRQKTARNVPFLSNKFSETHIHFMSLSFRSALSFCVIHYSRENTVIVEAQTKVRFLEVARFSYRPLCFETYCWFIVKNDVLSSEMVDQPDPYGLDKFRKMVSRLIFF